MKNLVILGSTGSIGTQALEVVSEHKEDLRVLALAAHKNTALLEEQIRAYRPAYCALFDEDAARDLSVRVKDLPVRVLSGMEGLIELASLKEADIVLTSLVGMIGIRPTIAAIEAGKDVALANKETLVAAGDIIMPLVKQHGVRLLPVDSEHSAIFQCLNGEEGNEIEEILLTASGGPFRGKKRDALVNVKKEDALKHPNWAMGAKITIDSATLANKGLEVIEAMHLFRVKPEAIHVLVQPQSIIHSMVRFTDGSVIAQLGLPDMKLPIQYAFFYPERVGMASERLSFEALKQITFEAPDTETFVPLSLAFTAARTRGTLPAVFNAANEEAVKLFLQDRISFLQIGETIRQACEAHRVIRQPSLDDIFAAEEEARAFVRGTV